MIIYLDFLALPRMGSHVKSDNTRTIITYTPLPIYLTLAPWFSVVAPFLQFIPTASYNGIPPLSKWWPPKHGRAVQKNTVPSKKGRETHSVTYVPGHSILFDLQHIVVQPPPSFLCCARPPSHNPSSLTSVSLVPVPHLLLPPTPFWPYGTHPLFQHAQTISTLSDLLNSLTPFLFRLSCALMIFLEYIFYNILNSITIEFSLSLAQYLK